MADGAAAANAAAAAFRARLAAVDAAACAERKRKAAAATVKRAVREVERAAVAVTKARAAAEERALELRNACKGLLALALYKVGDRVRGWGGKVGTVEEVGAPCAASGWAVWYGVRFDVGGGRVDDAEGGWEAL